MWPLDQGAISVETEELLAICASCQVVHVITQAESAIRLSPGSLVMFNPISILLRFSKQHVLNVFMARTGRREK